MRLEGEEYGKRHATEFLNAHLPEFVALIAAYPDASAESVFDDLRARFWARKWVPKRDDNGRRADRARAT